MCGILGTINIKTDKQKFEKSLDLMTHRGPDGKGIWFSEDGLCVLGHRRLAIIDLSDDGKQPMLSDDGRFCITFNGEIYNYIETRKELEDKGYRFKSKSDTEVILYAYYEWGTNCFDRFNGMWSLAIYDSQKRELILCRDRFGVKPLFYSTDGHGLYFGSEMKSLIPLIPKKSINGSLLCGRERLYSYESSKECLINEIERLPAGSYVRYTKDGLMPVVKWWNTLDNIPVVSGDYNTQCEELRALFIDSCKIRMRSDVTLGTALSGGLDSTATICTMSYVSKNNLGTDINNNFQHAYVAAFGNSVLDETKYAKIVTDYLDMPNTIVHVDPIKGAAELSDYIYGYEEIYPTSPIPMIQTYSALRKDRVFVTLDGHGADELFGGYETDILYALLDVIPFSKDMDEVLNSYKKLFRDLEYWNISSNNNKIYLDFMLRRIGKKILNIHCFDDCLESNKKDKFYSMSHFNRALYNATHHTVLPTLLRNYDRYSMYNGVEIRMPFLDYRIVCYAFALAWSSKLNGGYTKRIIRDSLQGIIPKEISERKVKIGFNSPFMEWIKGPMKEWILDTVDSETFRNCIYIDSKAIKKKVEQVILTEAASYSDGEMIWMDLMPYLWEEHFYKRAISI